MCHIQQGIKSQAEVDPPPFPRYRILGQLHESWGLSFLIWKMGIMILLASAWAIHISTAWGCFEDQVICTKRLSTMPAHIKGSACVLQSVCDESSQISWHRSQKFKKAHRVRKKPQKICVYHKSCLKLASKSLGKPYRTIDVKAPPETPESVCLVRPRHRHFT